MRRTWFLLIPLLALDILTKILARGVYLPLFPYVSITYTENTGVLFGFFQDTNLLWIFFSIFMIGALLYIYRTHTEYHMSILFILAGALGNLIDRIVYGFIVDFLDIAFWPIFNLADVAIITGILLFLFQVRKNTKPLKQNS